MSDYTVSVLCPCCDTEMLVDVTVSGGFAAATRWEPAEYPEVDFECPLACPHESPEDEHNVAIHGGPYTASQRIALENAIEEAALEAVKDAQYDPAWDGPEDEVEEYASGRLSIRHEIGHVPPSLTELLAIELAARDAIKNYDPSDADLESFNSMPSPRDLQEEAGRQQRELKR